MILTAPKLLHTAIVMAARVDFDAWDEIPCCAVLSTNPVELVQEFGCNSDKVKQLGYDPDWLFSMFEQISTLYAECAGEKGEENIYFWQFADEPERVLVFLGDEQGVINAILEQVKDYLDDNEEEEEEEDDTTEDFKAALSDAVKLDEEEEGEVLSDSDDGNDFADLDHSTDMANPGPDHVEVELI